MPPPVAWPDDKAVGDAVFAGTICLTGALSVRAMACGSSGRGRLAEAACRQDVRTGIATMPLTRRPGIS